MDSLIKVVNNCALGDDALEQLDEGRGSGRQHSPASPCSFGSSLLLRV